MALSNEIINTKGYINKPHLMTDDMIEKKNIIGLIIPSLSYTFLSELMEGIEEACNDDSNIFICHSRGEAYEENRYLKLLKEKNADGIIIFPVNACNRLYNSISQCIPMLSVIRKIEKANISSITVDDYTGSYKIVEYLIKKGHKRIAFINGTQTISTAKERWRGAKDAALDYDITIEDALISFAKYSVQSGYSETLKLFKNTNLPTAVYASSQLLGLGAMKAIKELGCRIPEDISLIAFDGLDETYAEDFVEPRITANRNEYKEMGKMAVHMLLEEISEKKNQKYGRQKVRNVVLNLEINERESVRSV